MDIKKTRKTGVEKELLSLNITPSGQTVTFLEEFRFPRRHEVQEFQYFSVVVIEGQINIERYMVIEDSLL